MSEQCNVLPFNPKYYNRLFVEITCLVPSILNEIILCKVWGIIDVLAEVFYSVYGLSIITSIVCQKIIDF